MYRSHFLPFVLRAARLAPGHRVLDVASGTGISAEAALYAVGPSGSVLATDISPEMVERARKRLRWSPNAAVAVEDGQALNDTGGPVTIDVEHRIAGGRRQR